MWHGGVVRTRRGADGDGGGGVSDFPSRQRRVAENWRVFSTVCRCSHPREGGASVHHHQYPSVCIQLHGGRDERQPRQETVGSACVSANASFFAAAETGHVSRTPPRPRTSKTRCWWISAPLEYLMARGFAPTTNLVSDPCCDIVHNAGGRAKCNCSTQVVHLCAPPELVVSPRLRGTSSSPKKTLGGSLISAKSSLYRYVRAMYRSATYVYHFKMSHIPASKLFSMSSLTALAGRWTTWWIDKRTDTAETHT